MPISVSPRATALSALSLLPPVAIFLAMLSLGNPERRLMSLIVLGVGVLSVVVGLNQIAQGTRVPCASMLRQTQLRLSASSPTEIIFRPCSIAVTMIAAAWAVEAAARLRGWAQKI